MLKPRGWEEKAYLTLAPDYTQVNFLDRSFIFVRFFARLCVAIFFRRHNIFFGGAKIFDTPTRFSRTVFVGNANPPSSDTLGVRGSRFPHSLTKLEIGVMLEQNATFYFTMVVNFIMKIRCYCSGHIRVTHSRKNRVSFSPQDVRRGATPPSGKKRLSPSAHDLLRSPAERVRHPPNPPMYFMWRPPDARRAAAGEARAGCSPPAAQTPAGGLRSRLPSGEVGRGR